MGCGLGLCVLVFGVVVFDSWGSGFRVVWCYIVVCLCGFWLCGWFGGLTVADLVWLVYVGRYDIMWMWVVGGDCG